MLPLKPKKKKKKAICVHFTPFISRVILVLVVIVCVHSFVWHTQERDECSTRSVQSTELERWSF